MPGLLGGVRVLESSMLLNGASTTMLLADLGAEVIKVESPAVGDYLRAPETFAMHVQANKNKRSIALDLRRDEGREVFYRLLETSDVVVTNAVADRNDKLGIGYDQLRSRKPDIVYCQNTGFGATGPYSTLPTHGQMMDSIAGALPVELDERDLTRFVVPPAGRRTGTMMSAGEGTSCGAVYAAFTIAAALTHRAMTGEGSYIDVAASTAVIANAWVAATHLLERAGAVPAAVADRDAIARYQFYETGDGHFILFCPEEDKFWLRFCRVVGRPDLDAQSFGLDLRRAVQEIFRTRTRDEWMELAVAHGLPIGPCHAEIGEIGDDPQIRARGIFVRGHHPDVGDVTYIGSPALVRGQPYAVSRPAPAHGEHTTEILLEAGYSPQRVKELADLQVTVSDDYRPEGPIGNVYGDGPRP